ncbi:hypothetical protein M0L20_00995 [Spirosoma sp. RP8]|uniref:DUF2383 domain-containing protein n=1 Tax=Spirosoma liriopis TaxID=2937440 RepID=A0ABT0HE25_9BACT|nr:hypothetical protein [Spirosoma liriopis]MCK8490404.1 hypothetical protein [Spirosoma liriopis]
MRNANQSFHKALDQYVFGIANKFIDSADPATQSELMNLVAQLDLVSHTGEAVDDKSAQPESEWQHILNKPVDWQSVHKQWLVGVMQQRTKRNEHYIDNLNQAIRNTAIRLQQTQDTFLREPYRSNLIHRHQLTLDYLQQHLSEVQNAHQFNLKQLDQLLSS